MRSLRTCSPGGGRDPAPARHRRWKNGSIGQHAGILNRPTRGFATRPAQSTAEDSLGWLPCARSSHVASAVSVISDQHAGLVAALRRSFHRASHQRCRVHFAPNLLALVPKSHQDLIATVFRTILAQPDPATVEATWEQVRGQLAGRFPKTGELMDDAKSKFSPSPPSPGCTRPRSGDQPARAADREVKRRPESRASSPTKHPSSASSAPSSPMSTTNGKPETVATSPRPCGADLPRARR